LLTANSVSFSVWRPGFVTTSRRTNSRIFAPLSFASSGRARRFYAFREMPCLIPVRRIALAHHWSPRRLKCDRLAAKGPHIQLRLPLLWKLQFGRVLFSALDLDGTCQTDDDRLA